MPSLIAEAGDAAGWRYVEFFTANIGNPDTRRAYARAAGSSPGAMTAASPSLQSDHTTPQLGPRSFRRNTGAGGEAAARRGADAVRLAHHRPGWVPTNPAAAARGPKYVVPTGKTPVLDGALLDAIPTETVRDLRDRALIGTLTYFPGAHRCGT